ncbi:MAG: hypothetical protein QM714_10670 [Nocardioides sp.]|uniref:sugar ABC transporter permease n=1 Tax=Nocardioides sp. TaxID=35761 RepID=UPI0039E5BA81
MPDGTTVPQVVVEGTANPDADDIGGHLPRARRRLNAGSAREVGLAVALLLVWMVLQRTTDGLFLTPRNLSNLSIQFSVTAILAVGIVVVMTAAEIDLSASATVGLCAILVARLTTDHGLNVWVAIAATLVFGLLIGVWHGVWVTVANVPSFITTLASLLGLGGLALVITDGQTTVVPDSLTFVANRYLPSWSVALLGVVVTLAVLALRWRELRLRETVGMDRRAGTTAVVPVLVTAGIATFAIYVFGSYRGLPLPVLILGVVAGVVAFVLRFSVFGKHVVAVGTDPEASRRAGIRVRWIRTAPFVLMGLLYGVAALIFVSRLGGAPAQGMVGEELNVIAAAVLGGTSLFGGVSRIGGAVVGALLMESLSNGMVLMNVNSFWQRVVVGAMLLLAVAVDVNLRRRSNG